MSVTASRIDALRKALAVCALALVIASAGRARAGDTEDARAYADKATTAFALGKYAVAAEYFEKAFELHSDPALLYNAAQSHRQAGNKERALLLYRNYLRLYAKKEKRAEIEARIDELEKAIANDKAVQSTPPNATEPIAGGGPARTAPPAPRVAPLEAAPPPPAAGTAPPSPEVVALNPEPPASSAPTLVAQPATAAQEDSLLKKPWFWVAAGAGVAVVVTVVLLLSMGGGTKDPSPSVGRINAN